MGSFSSWVQFPEINRKILVNGSWSTFGEGLGCHTGSISNVSCHISRIYSMNSVFSNYSKIKTDEGDPIGTCKYTTGMYQGYVGLSQKEQEMFDSYIESLDDDWHKNFVECTFKPLIEKCKTVPLWVLSDVINYKSPARHSGKEEKVEKFTLKKLNDNSNGIESLGKTCDFADYLISKNIGYVMESPIVQNPNHAYWGGYSLNRAWFWIPPSFAGKTLGVSGEYGRDSLLKYDEWKEKTMEALKKASYSSLHASVEKLNESTPFERLVFDGGIVPDDKRFTRTAKEA